MTRLLTRLLLVAVRCLSWAALIAALSYVWNVATSWAGAF